MPRERLIEQALTLIVLHESAPGQPADTALPLQHWRGRSAEHDAAAKEAQRRWDALGGMAAEMRTRFREAPSQQTLSGPGQSRRKLLLGIAAVLGTGALAGKELWQYWQQPIFAAAYSTPTAETLQVALPDGRDGGAGSRMDLAPKSAADVSLYAGRRLVFMHHGEIRFDVAHQREQPFVVVTREARIEVVGTVFSVRDRGAAVTVGVERGHVRVQVFSRDAKQAAAQRGESQKDWPTKPEITDLYPGQVMDIHDGLAGPVRVADATALSAWRDGWLVFENARLADALSSVNAYRTLPIITSDPRVASLRISGRFRAYDSTGLLAVLPTILPVYALTLGDGSVALQAR